MLRSQGDYDEAIPLAQSLAGRLSVELGDNDYRTQDAADQVVTLQLISKLDPDALERLRAGDREALRFEELTATGRMDEGLALAREQVALRADLFGNTHREALTWMMHLAMFAKDGGRMAESVIMLRRTMDAMRTTLGRDHPQYGLALSQLAQVLHAQGRLGDSEALFREVYDHRRRVLGAGNLSTLGAMHNLAMMLHSVEQSTEAESLLREALNSYRAVTGDSDHNTLIMTSSLAKVLLTLGDLDEAEQLSRLVHDARIARFGENHPVTSQSVFDLADVAYLRGQLDNALAMTSDAFRTHREAMGSDHYLTVIMQRRLGELLYEAGRISEAIDNGQAAAVHFESVRQLLSVTGFERVKFATEASPLPILAASLAHAGQFERAFEALEANLGRGLFDAIDATHSAVGVAEAEQRTMLQRQLADANNRLGALRESEGDHETRTRLLERRNEVLVDLTELEQGIAAQRHISSGHSYGLEAIQEALPARTAIVAWLDVATRPGRITSGWAVVVRSDQATAWVALEPHDAADYAAIRSALANPKAPLADAMVNAIRAHSMSPLRPHLIDIDHVVILPGGLLDGIPVEVIAPDYTISYAPSATILAWLRHKSTESNTSTALLGIGDPVFAASDGIPRLPGTRKELEAIAALFDKSAVDLLLGPQANEAQLDTLVEDSSLSLYSHVHIATHGVLDDRTPWESALLLTPQHASLDLADLLSDVPIHDGRLSASQIVHRWKLDANLVVLSGCDTALGRAEGGEGFVGFSQALFVSGARRLILSLWKVDDRATTLLMTRFYENLLGRFEGTRSVGRQQCQQGSHNNAAVALREAKTWLRNQRPQDNRRRLTELGIDTTKHDRSRGDILTPGEKPRRPFDYSHPHYWAAFILSGDPQ
jgi:CHAT domain-containing protein/tetratricopeptide (TPR) repeat protein